MKHRKSILPIIVSSALLLLILVTFFSIKNKLIDKPAPSASLAKVNNKNRFTGRSLRNIKYERTAQRLKQGEYLTNGILQCFTCHSPRNWEAPGAPPLLGKLGSGGTVVNQDSTTLVIAPNITSDKVTGAGNWTDDMLARAIREGVGHDGRALSWQMPYYFFRNLTDEDLASVIVYLRSIPPIHHVVPPSKRPQAERLEREKTVSSLRQPISRTEFVDPKKRGKYLVTLGECVACHTSYAEYNPGLFGGGNLMDRFGHKTFSANITISPSGIFYGPQGFIFVMRTGKGGTLSPIMPWVAFKNMNDDDLKAIYAYLNTIPASNHYINNQLPFTHCAICGMEHGLGVKNKREKPSGIKLDPGLYDEYVGTYLDEEDNIIYIILKDRNQLMGMQRENGRKTALIPESALHFSAPGWPLAVTFVKDSNGHVTRLVEDTDFGATFLKIK